MKIRYVGPANVPVEIAATGQRCARGEPVDVKADLARSLLKQATWEKVVEPPPEDSEPEADEAS